MRNDQQTALHSAMLSQSTEEEKEHTGPEALRENRRQPRTVCSMIDGSKKGT